MRVGSKKGVRRVVGSIIRIPLEERTFSLAVVLGEPVIGFFNKKFQDGAVINLNVIASIPFVFRIMVMNYAVTDGLWDVVGKITPPARWLEPTPFCKYDEITGEFTVYHEIPSLAPLYERPSTFEECAALETAAVWEPEHVEDRLRDHFAGRDNVWVQSLKPSKR